VFEKGGSEDQAITTILHKTHLAERTATPTTQTSDELTNTNVDCINSTNPGIDTNKERMYPISTGGKGSIFIVSSIHLQTIPARKWSPGFLDAVRKVGETDIAYVEARKAVQNTLRLGYQPDDRQIEEEAVPYQEH
jgi:hypothetical protein